MDCKVLILVNSWLDCFRLHALLPYLVQFLNSLLLTLELFYWLLFLLVRFILVYSVYVLLRKVELAGVWVNYLVHGPHLGVFERVYVVTI